MIASKTRIAIVELLQSADKQTRTENQNKRDRHLRCDKKFTQTILRSFRRRVDLQLRSSQRRNEAEQNTGHNGNKSSESEDAKVRIQIQRNGIPSGRKKIDQSSAAPESKTGSQYSAQNTQHQAFNKQLTNESH